MNSRQGVLKIFTLILVVSLLLVACERPLQNAEEQIEDVATDVPEAAGEAATEVAEGVEEATQGEETEGAVATEGETPAPTEEEAAEEATVVATPAAEETVVATPAGETPAGEGTPPPEDEGEATAEATEAATEEATEAATEEATEEATAEGTEDAEEAADAEQPEDAEEEAAEEAAAEETEAEEAAEETTADQPASQERLHVVQAGENLYRIGLQYGVSWAVLAQYNNIGNPNAISVGQQIKIPPSQPAPGSPTPTPSPATETTYVVKAGDTLYRIGRMFNVSWVQIAEANGIINPNRIFVGQVLKIPTAAPGPTPQFTHTVQQGESLFTISLRYGVAWSTIAEANNLSSPYVIYPGQTLVIPGG